MKKRCRKTAPFSYLIIVFRLIRDVVAYYTTTCYVGAAR